MRNCWRSGMKAVAAKRQFAYPAGPRRGIRTFKPHVFFFFFHAGLGRPDFIPKIHRRCAVCPMEGEFSIAFWRSPVPGSHSLPQQKGTSATKGGFYLCRDYSGVHICRRAQRVAERPRKAPTFFWWHVPRHRGRSVIEGARSCLPTCVAGHERGRA